VPPFRDKTYEMEVEFLDNIKVKLPQMEAKLDECQSMDNYENLFYRFYHQSNKVYQLQTVTQEILDLLKEVAPKGKSFCKYFQEIIDAGASGKEFSLEHNDDWTTHTRPMIEAFCHARYFLEMCIKCSKELSKPPSPMPYGYAALMELFDIWGYADFETRMLKIKKQKKKRGPSRVH
jgi:hypothetical protein